MTLDDVIAAEQRHLQALEDHIHCADAPGSIMTREVAEATVEAQRAKVDALIAKRGY